MSSFKLSCLASLTLVNGNFEDFTLFYQAFEDFGVVILEAMVQRVKNSQSAIYCASSALFSPRSIFGVNHCVFPKFSRKH